jgi:hypothetical protein
MSREEEINNLANKLLQGGITKTFLDAKKMAESMLDIDNTPSDKKIDNLKYPDENKAVRIDNNNFSENFNEAVQKEMNDILDENKNISDIKNSKEDSNNNVDQQEEHISYESSKTDNNKSVMSEENDLLNTSEPNNEEDEIIIDEKKEDVDKSSCIENNPELVDDISEGSEEILIGSDQDGIRDSTEDSICISENETCDAGDVSDHSDFLINDNLGQPKEEGVEKDNGELIDSIDGESVDNSISVEEYSTKKLFEDDLNNTSDSENVNESSDDQELTENRKDVTNVDNIEEEHIDNNSNNSQDDDSFILSDEEKDDITNIF